MIIIPGWLISILTFPGIIIHEWAHKQCCVWAGIPVYKVVYFRLGNPAGYVLHEETRTYKQIFLISVGPLIINSLSTLFLGFFLSGFETESFLTTLLLWLAVSIGMHSFPSDNDMKHIWEASKNELKKGGSILHYLAFPFVILIFIANKLRFIWFDLWYALGLVALSGGLSV